MKRIETLFAACFALFIAISGLGCSASAKATKRFSPLSFSPADLNVDGTFPGVHKFTVTLQNHEMRALKVNMSMTCGCLKILEPKFPIAIPAKGSQKVVIEFTADRQENINQAVYAMAGRLSPSAELPIRGRLGSPIARSTSELALALKRPLPGAKTSRETVTLQLNPDVQVTSIASDVPSLQPTYRQKGDQLSFSLEADADSEDQDTTAGVMLFYKAEGFAGKCQVPVHVSIASEFKFDRSSFWLGRLKQGEHVERKVTIKGKGAATRINLKATSAGDGVQISRNSPDEITAILAVTGAAKTGLTTSHFDVLLDGQKTGAVTCSYQSTH